MANSSVGASIEMRGICKQYPGSLKMANNNITLDLYKGEILCIAGENGAGKTTLMKILMGLVTPDCGEIYVNGKKAIITSALDAKKLGISMVYQHFMLIGEYTAAENIVFGNEPVKFGIFFDTKKANDKAEQIINNYGFSINCRHKVKDISFSEMQQVEICRALFCDARILILDEPTAVLNEKETQSLFKTLKSLAANGISIILITHKPHEIRQICNRLAVLKKGELKGIYNNENINEYDIAGLMTESKTESKTETKIEMKIETKNYNIEIVNRQDQMSREPHNIILEFENVTVTRHRQKQPLLDNVSFQARKSEILGITGISGNGLGVIEAVLGGFLHPSKGNILFKGTDISNLDTCALRNQGLSYVPSDRLRVGIARDADIKENIIINRRAEFAKWQIFNNKKILNFSKNLIKNYNIEGGNEVKKTSHLSGGNLQKLILAREIEWLKEYIILCEPTWGLDIASANFIMTEIKNLRKRDAAIIVISTNTDEILSLCDRILVMYKGAAINIPENDNIDESILNRYMQGLTI